MPPSSSAVQVEGARNEFSRDVEPSARPHGATPARSPLSGARGKTDDLVGLSLIGKQLHWAVVGERFRPLHLQLDELVGSWRDLSDAVAERAVALGHVPDGQPQAVAGGSEIGPVARTSIEDHTVVRELTDRIAKVSELTRTRMDRLAEIDLVTQDVLIDVVRKLEEQQWMLRAQLSGRP
jgi:starvation-inducible DNA-binding protein